MRQIREYCGIFGIYNAQDAAHKIYMGLHALQHRGQESAGIVTSGYDEGKGKKISDEELKRLSAFTDFIDSLDLEDFDKNKS